VESDRHVPVEGERDLLCPVAKDRLAGRRPSAAGNEQVVTSPSLGQLDEYVRLVRRRLDDRPEIVGDGPLEELDDVETIGAVESRLATGRLESFDAVRDLVNYATRDHARTPVQWTDDPHAGFTDGEGGPWFRVNDDYPTVNVRRARAEAGSIWHHYRRLIDLRHEWDVLVYGDYECLLPDHEQLFVYTRTLSDQRWLVVLNWSSTPARLASVALPTERAEVILDSAGDAPADPVGAEFRPYQT
jgi:oligo-1,6-glucosidase